MRWRDVLVGSIATLIVTILSGIAVFYLTRVPEVKPSELLGYSVEQSASFESANNRVALVNVTILNKGDATADTVVGSIEFPFGTIKDKKIIPSSGNVSGFLITSETQKRLDFRIPSFLPKEKVSISFLMESSTTPKPNVSLKSAKSIGQEMSLLTATQDATVSSTKKIVSFFTPLFFGLIMILLLLLMVKQRLSRLSRGSSLNNNGFVFLHKGLTDLAQKLLFRAIAKGQDACHPIANYASCLAIKGDTEAAMQYLSAADFLARSPHRYTDEVGHPI